MRIERVEMQQFPGILETDVDIPVNHMAPDERERTILEELLAHHVGAREAMVHEDHSKKSSDYLERLMGGLVRHVQLDFKDKVVGYTTPTEAHMVTPSYHLFKSEDPIVLACELTVWVHFGDKLTCRSYLTQSTPPHGGGVRVHRDLYRALSERITNLQGRRGTHRGSHLYFAPVTEAVPIMQDLREAVRAIGPDQLKESRLLYETAQGKREGEEKDIFTRIYKKHLASLLFSVGLQEQQFEQGDMN